MSSPELGHAVKKVKFHPKKAKLCPQCLKILRERSSHYVDLWRDSLNTSGKAHLSEIRMGGGDYEVELCPDCQALVDVLNAKIQSGRKPGGV